MGAEYVPLAAPTVPSQFRLTVRDMLAVATGCLTPPTGTTMLLMAIFVFTLPVVASSVVQPCTNSPVLVRRVPVLSTWKLPARV